MSAATSSGAGSRATGAIIRQVRAGFVQMMAVMIMILPFFGMVAQYGVGEDAFSGPQIAINLMTIAVGIGAIALARRGQIIAASVVASLVLIAGAVFVSQQDVRVLLSILAVVVTATLSGRWYFRAVVTVLILIQITSFVTTISSSGLGPNAAAVEAVISGGIIIIVAILFRRLFTVASRMSDNAEQSYSRLTSIAAVGRQTSRLLRLEDVLNESVNMIKSQFNFYHVQIFLVDERREFAVLSASTGEAGRRLLARNHKLGVGSESVIGRVTLANEPILINDTENEPGHKFNELLPETRAELALPMQVQADGENRVMGALDVQAEDPFAFSPTDVQALQALANQLAVAIRNAQLFETQENSLKENLRLYSDAHASLEEIQRLNRQLTRQAWDGYTESHSEMSSLLIEGESITFGAGWTPLMIEACHARDTITHKDDGVRVTATPILLRDEILGAVQVVGGDEEEINLIEAIVAFTERFAVALENVRLVEEAQAASSQEQRISAVVSRFQEAETVDELLQITLAELAETLEADGGSIRIGLTAAASQATR